jgi:hypothetical protein
MAPESNERSLKQTQDDMADEADRMEARLDELGEHRAAAEKQAAVTREHAGPEAEEPLGDVAGDATDTARTDDDPAGAVDEPPDAQ